MQDIKKKKNRQNQLKFIKFVCVCVYETLQTLTGFADINIS